MGRSRRRISAINARTRSRRPAGPSDEIPFDRGDPALAERFEPPVFHRYEREITYTTASYLDLLLTYSGHRALPPPAQQGLLGCITRHADEHHGGRITKRYLHELRVTRSQVSTRP
ncbi:MAG: hypothetical protein LC808_02595 [Actinobacteria bacterium]|nr:hypothetical protein [Actinomycetota bacterium]